MCELTEQQYCRLMGFKNDQIQALIPLEEVAQHYVPVCQIMASAVDTVPKA